ncbi:MAG: hypothetical protein ABI602_00495 [Candidatus Saccharibacteria bacterium]
MEKVPLPEEGFKQAKVNLSDELEQDCQRFALRWGGTDYRDGLIDGVAMKRGVRELNDSATTAVTFIADRVRLPGGFQNFYTIYTTTVEVERQITKLPTNVYQQVIEEYDMEFVDAADELMEIHRLTCIFRDDSADFKQELEVSYIMDGQQLEFDVDGWDECEDEPRGKTTEIEEDEPELSTELSLLNDAWELIAEAGKKIQQNQLPFDLSVLRNMARIQKRLDIKEASAEKLFSMVRLELRDLQIQNCQRILKKLSPRGKL